MIILNERPPNFELIQKHFPNAAEPGVIFAYSGGIYNPGGKPIPPALLAHEQVHLRRQELHGADVWWDHYIIDHGFRYHEELLAHAAEMKMQRTKDRNAQAALLMRTALRLTAKLYNYDPPRSMPQAIKDLKQEIAK